MSNEIILTTVILTTLISTIFVVAINYKFRKHDIRQLDFKSIATQLVALTVWVAILGDLFLTNDPNKQHIDITVFLVSVVMGIFLIRSLFEESKMQDVVQNLVKKLNEDNEKLRKLDKQKTEFVSLASHQLRGPLSVINGYISMIVDKDFGEIPAEMQEPIYRIARSSKALGLLINDYLDVAKIEKGEMEYIIQEINLKDLLTEITEEFKVVSEKNNLDFIFKHDCPNETTIKADQLKMRQIVSNVIDNAIKYTKKGFVEMSCKVEHDEIKIIVKDSGIGIAPEKQSEIFNKFIRDENAMKMNVVGTGLGLFVAKVMLEAQGGEISVFSEGIGKGSTFTITFPQTSK
jgi:signal transduction histidine kinase